MSIAGPELFAELEFLYLPGGGMRNFRAEEHLFRNFVPGELRASVSDQFGFGHRFAVTQDHHGRDGFTPPVVGYGEDRGICHCGMREKYVLDLDGADVFSAGDNDVLFSIGDSQVSVRPNGSAVTGVEPSLLSALAVASG